MPFSKFAGEGDLARIHAVVTTTKAKVPAEIVTALERWDRLRRAAKPARPDREAVLSRVGAAMARAVRTGQPTLRHPGTVDVGSLVPAEILKKALDQLAEEALVADAFPKAKTYTVEVAMRVVIAHEEALVASLQRRYEECAETFRSAAVELPETFTADMASIAKDDLAAAWRTCVDGFEEMTTIRSVIDSLSMPGSTDADVLGQRYLKFAKSPVVREASPVRENTPTFGHPETLAGHLALARLVEAGDLWCPTPDEASARAAELWPNEILGVQVVM